MLTQQTGEVPGTLENVAFARNIYWASSIYRYPYNLGNSTNRWDTLYVKTLKDAAHLRMSQVAVTDDQTVDTTQET